MSKSQTTSKVLHLNDIAPYWRNPRIITDEAVNAVAESIKRYGYQQPIVVDEDNVIVIGHTRYAALRRLGIEEAQVLVTDLPNDKINQLRVMDNRTAEFGGWDFNKLSDELESLDKELMASYFPEAGDLSDSGPNGNYDFSKPLEPEPKPEQEMAQFVCPACFHEVGS